MRRLALGLAALLAAGQARAYTPVPYRTATPTPTARPTAPAPFPVTPTPTPIPTWSPTPARSPVTSPTPGPVVPTPSPTPTLPPGILAGSNCVSGAACFKIETFCATPSAASCTPQTVYGQKLQPFVYYRIDVPCDPPAPGCTAKTIYADSYAVSSALVP